MVTFTPFELPHSSFDIPPPQVFAPVFSMGVPVTGKGGADRQRQCAALGKARPSGGSEGVNSMNDAFGKASRKLMLSLNHRSKSRQHARDLLFNQFRYTNAYRHHTSKRRA